ncbi:3'-5' exonuclease [Lacticaseibacillus songhuajiangensis]|uniref:3'-5' exonuclease n=1 Tax=Lacticaseibacillus songhuajiangensis TaxID=1296539 RepID=UPI000F7945E1|nr:exonuclease domain-containing protein [Lacticaseibacillus songhuajiangensis]
MKKSGTGCLGTAIIVMLIALAIYFWWILLIAAVLILVIFLIAKKTGKSSNKNTSSSKEFIPDDSSDSKVMKKSSEEESSEIPIPVLSDVEYKPSPVVHKLRRKLHSYVVFDIETTGLNRYEDEIIQISGVKVRADEVVGTFNSYVQPIESIPENITYLVAGELALTFRQIRDNFVINLHRSLILFGSNRNWST